MKGGVLGTLLASIGIPEVLNALTGQGLHNRPTGGYKTHRSKIPMPNPKNSYMYKNNFQL